MERVLIDSFVVPEESRDAFLEQVRQTQGYIKTLPGFIEGYVYENRDGVGRFNFLTIAVWKDEAALENAKQAVATENQKRGIKPREVIRQLGVESTRALYERSPY